MHLMAIMIIPPATRRPRRGDSGGSPNHASKVTGTYKAQTLQRLLLRQPSINMNFMQICQVGVMGDRGQHTRETGNLADPSIAHARLVLTLFQHESRKLLPYYRKVHCHFDGKWINHRPHVSRDRAGRNLPEEDKVMEWRGGERHPGQSQEHGRGREGEGEEEQPARKRQRPARAANNVTPAGPSRLLTC